MALTSMWNRRAVFLGTLALIGIVAAWRIYLLSTRPDLSHRIYFAFDTRADELLIGCALGLWQGRVLLVPFLRPLWPVLVAALGLVVIKMSNFDPLTSLSYPLLGASAGCLIIILTDEGSSILKRLLSLSPIVALGRISYGFYLWHLPIIMIVNDHLVRHRTILAFCLTLAASATSYWLIERPFLHLKPPAWAQRCCDRRVPPFPCPRAEAKPCPAAPSERR